MYSFTVFFFSKIWKRFLHTILHKICAIQFDWKRFTQHNKEHPNVAFSHLNTTFDNFVVGKVNDISDILCFVTKKHQNESLKAP